MFRLAFNTVRAAAAAAAAARATVPRIASVGTQAGLALEFRVVPQTIFAQRFFATTSTGRRSGSKISPVAADAARKAKAAQAERARQERAAKQLEARAKKMKQQAREKALRAAKRAKELAKRARAKALEKARAKRVAERTAPLRTLSVTDLTRTQTSRNAALKRLKALEASISEKARLKASIPKPLTLLSLFCKEKQVSVAKGAALIKTLSESELKSLQARLEQYQAKRAEQLARVPKAPTTGFIRFCNEMRAKGEIQVTAATPVQANREFVKACSAQWKSMSEQERKAYSQGLEQARAEYRQQLDAYLAKYAPIPKETQQEIQALKEKLASLNQTLRVNAIRELANSRRASRM